MASETWLERTALMDRMGARACWKVWFSLKQSLDTSLSADGYNVWSIRKSQSPCAPSDPSVWSCVFGCVWCTQCNTMQLLFWCDFSSDSDFPPQAKWACTARSATLLTPGCLPLIQATRVMLSISWLLSTASLPVVPWHPHPLVVFAITKIVMT